MTRSSSVVFSFFIILLLLGVSGLAQKPTATQSQTPPAQQRRDDPAQKIGVLEVRLPISVKQDKKFIEGLTVNNFEVYEDGKRQKIEKFMAPSVLPLRIALLMDTSNSVKLKLPFEKDSAEDFSATITNFKRKDQLLVASFDSDVELHQDFTDNLQLIVEAIRKLKAGGVTRLYDCIYRVIEEKMANLQRDEARRIVVVLSDGEDTASEHTLKETIEMAQRYDVTIFGISTKNFRGITAGQVESADDKELRRLCEETGGQIFLPSEKLALFKAFTEVGKDLRLEYVLFYTPTNQQRSSKQREIKVKLVAVDGRPFHKRGYVY